MLQSSESETEILLGNKQLLGIFFLVAALLGIAFTGGYMVGRNASAKKTAATVGPADAAASAAAGNSSSAGETHSVQPEDTSDQDSAGTGQAGNRAARAVDEPLGSRKHKSAKLQPAEPPSQPVNEARLPDGFSPQSGQEFLQVVAVSRDDANAIAQVLRKKGFRAHSVPKPGNPNLYRVIVGPIRDAGDLSSTRDSLRKTGFRDVIVQHYQ